MDPSQLHDLLGAWEEGWARGELLTPGELSPAAPELWPELQRRIERRRAFLARLHQTTIDTRTVSSDGIPEIPGYRIHEEISRGGQAVVYRATHLALRRDVAIKLIRLHSLSRATQMARFRVEAEAVARLNHPHIVQLYEIGEHGNDLYFALEFLRGGNLRSRYGGQPQAPAEAAATMATLARAIQVAHEQGIVHRDLKPGNVLLTAEGLPKIADFGLAKLARPESDLVDTITESGAVLGTVCYIAPEYVASNGQQVSAAVDIYALGCMLYEALVGRVPFQGRTQLDTLDLIRSGQVISPRTLIRQVPRDLETICLKCLERNPARRYDSAAALADDLERFLRHEPIKARPVGAAGQAARWARRNPQWAALLGSLMLFTIVVAGLALRMRQQRDELAQQRDELALEYARSKASQADAARANPRIGRRWQSLELVSQAAEELRRRAPGDLPALQDLALSFLPLDDLRLLDELQLPPLRCVSCDPQLRRAAVNDQDGKVGIWDLHSHRREFELPDIGSPHGFVDLGFSPDGKYLAANYRRTDQRPQSIVWDLQSEAASSETAIKVFPLGFHPREQRVCAAAPEGDLVLWDFPGDTTRVLLPRAVGVLYQDARFSPDGARLAVSLIEGPAFKVRIVRIDGTIEQELESEVATHSSLAWSPDGRRLAFGRPDFSIAIWNIPQKRLESLLEGHSGPVLFCQFLKNHLLNSVALDHTCRLWDAPVGRLLLNIPGVYAKQGEPGELAVYSQGQVSRFAIEHALERAIAYPDNVGNRSNRRLQAEIRSSDFHPTEPVAVTGSTDCLTLWDYVQGRELGTVRGLRTEFVRFHPRGDALFAYGASGLWRYPIAKAEGSWQIGAGEQFGGFAEDYFQAFDWLEGGKCLALLDNNPARVCVFDLQSPQSPQEFKCESGFLTSIVSSPDGKWLAAGVFSEPRVRIWDLAAHTELQPLLTSTDDRNARNVVQISGDGSLLACLTLTASRGTIKAWHTNDWREAWSIPCDATAALVAPVLSPRGDLIVASVDSYRLQFGDPRTGAVHATLKWDDALLPTPLGFNPAGNVLAVKTREGPVQFWRLDLVRQKLRELGFVEADRWLNVPGLTKTGLPAKPR